jgi:integrase
LFVLYLLVAWKADSLYIGCTVSPEAQIAAYEVRPARYMVRVHKSLFLEVLPSGHKVWRWRARINGSLRGMTLGRWPAMTELAAKRKAQALLKAIEDGSDPVEEAAAKRRMKLAGKAITFEAFARRWVLEVVRKVRKNPTPVEQMLKRAVLPKLGKRQMRAISKEDVQAIIFAKRDQGRPAAAIHLRHTLKRIFDYAKVCGAVDANPVDATPRRTIATLRSASRVLSEGELKIVFQRLRDPGLNVRMALALRLLLLTLVRKSELIQATWDDVYFEQPHVYWIIPEKHSKTGVAHIVYLSDQARAAFAQLRRLSGKANAVFPWLDSLVKPIGAGALNKAIARHKWGISRFTPHDLRRTAATHLYEQGYPADVVEKALNHTVKGVRGVYNRAEFAEPRRKMLQAWADWLDGLEA